MCVGEHVYRPSLLCDPVLDKIDNNNNNNFDSNSLLAQTVTSRLGHVRLAIQEEEHTTTTRAKMSWV